MANVEVREPDVASWANFENLIHRNYLSVLNQAAAVSPRDLEGHDFNADCDCVQIDHLTRIVYDKNEDNLSKFGSVYSSLTLAGQSAFLFVCRNGAEIDFYVGTRGLTQDSAIAGRNILEGSIRGNFPGAQLAGISEKRVRELSKGISQRKCVSIVTGVPDIKKGTEESFSQGLEKIIDAQGDKDFSIVILASPVSNENLLTLERGYQDLSSQLSLLNVSQLSLSRQDTRSFSSSVGESVSRTLSDSISLANTISTSETKTKTPAQALAASGAAIGAVVGTAVGPEGTAAGAVLGGAIGGAVGSIVGSFFGSTAKTKGESQSETSTHTVSITNNETVTFSVAESETAGTSMTYSIQDRRVADALAIVDEQLNRIRMAKSYGAWRFAAYFLSDVSEAAQTGANVFAGLLRGEQTGVERCSISNWTSDDKQFHSIVSDLSCFEHPQFRIGKTRNGKGIDIEPTSVVTTPELAVGMCLPQKSVPGLPVFESVEFGRSVTTYDAATKIRGLRVGSISHLGSECAQDVTLNIDSFTAHLFVTGSTGAGKSNFVYNVLSGVRKQDVKFLVVEPAKGEYKNKFGGCADVTVYGTNPDLFSHILRLNPFSFPAGVHIMEHIDRLIEILNAAWPMYAAMPAILKDAVEQAYKREGWDLLRSRCLNEDGVIRFPDFHDLMDVLPMVINNSDYDSEVKSNYTGSLVTRVKALTQGYYRLIFQKDEVRETDLFERSCIIDISRIGATETKSLIMGVVFMKLLEHRMTENVGENLPLRHITVLEEAHNLLRKTSSAQSMETANLAGKSVEMMTNAIAEMRTYGEGFLIADQAPGLLDEAVIRNTNTKVAFRLPDLGDRELVGKSQNLSDEQIRELARLRTGCAAIYQNNWQEAVLCQTPVFKSDDCCAYIAVPTDSNYKDARSCADDVFVRILIGRISKTIDLSGIVRALSDEDFHALEMYYPGSVLYKKADLSNAALLDEVYMRFVKKPLKDNPKVKDRTLWTKMLIDRVFDADVLRHLDLRDKDVMLKSIFDVLSIYDPHVEQRKLWLAESKDISKWRAW